MTRDPWALYDFRGLWGTEGMRCFSRYDGLEAVRITPLGAWILGQNDRYVPTVAESPPEPVPVAEERILDELHARGGDVRVVGAATLVEVSSRELAEALARDRRLKELCWLVGERILVVREADVRRFRAALRGCGFVLGGGVGES